MRLFPRPKSRIRQGPSVQSIQIFKKKIGNFAIFFFKFANFQFLFTKLSGIDFHENVIDWCKKHGCGLTYMVVRVSWRSHFRAKNACFCFIPMKIRLNWCGGMDGTYDYHGFHSNNKPAKKYAKQCSCSLLLLPILLLLLLLDYA